ncbi:hypothetical protein FRC12_016628 [Ceratobasidium sp. 428]|nr:hypothetical protein FRC12_016628 [Ceratobasidium sp. 428]
MSAGTESPPLEATGEHQPIGAASKSGQPLPEGVKDTQQRGQYFGGEETKDTKTSGSGASAEAIAAAEKSAKDVESKQPK